MALFQLAVGRLRPHLLFLLILAVGLFVRFYNFPAWQGFDYDQEINAWLAKSLIVDHKLFLIGPETSVGAMYVGPYFNYIISFFYLLGKMDHAWTILLNFIISTVTIAAIYLTGAKFFSKVSGLISATIYSFSMFFISYDRVMWNPTILPLVSVGVFYFLYSYLKNHKVRDLILATTILGFSFHVHFTAFFLLAFFVLSLTILGGNKFWKSPLNFLYIVSVLVIFFLPLIFFDLRHNFLNFSHLLLFLTSGRAGGLSGIGILVTLGNVLLVWADLIKSIFIEIINIKLIPLSLLFLVLIFKHGFKSGGNKLFYKLLLLLFLLITIPLSFYRGALPPYYFLAPLSIIVISSGDLFYHITKKYYQSNIFIVLITGLILLNLMPALFTKSDFSLKNKSQTVKYIISQSQGQSFKVDFITSLGLNTGFKYLFWQQGEILNINMNTKTDKTFKIVIPKSLARPEELSVVYGAIGIVKMEL